MEQPMLYDGLMDIRYYTVRDEQTKTGFEYNVQTVGPEKFLESIPPFSCEGIFMQLTIGNYKFTIERDYKYGGGILSYRLILWKGHAIIWLPDQNKWNFDTNLKNHNLPSANHIFLKIHRKVNHNLLTPQMSPCIRPQPSELKQMITLRARGIGSIISILHQVFQPELEEVYIRKTIRWTFLNCNHRMPSMNKPYLSRHICRMVISYLEN